MAGNGSVVKQANESDGQSHDSHHGDCGCKQHSKDDSGSSQSNESTVEQG